MATKLEALPKRLADYRQIVVKQIAQNQNLHERKYITKGLYLRIDKRLQDELKALDTVTDNIYSRLNPLP